MNEVDELLELRECYIFSLSRKFFVKQGPDLFYLLSYSCWKRQNYSFLKDTRHQHLRNM